MPRSKDRHLTPSRHHSSLDALATMMATSRFLVAIATLLVVLLPSSKGFSSPGLLRYVIFSQWRRAHLSLSHSLLHLSHHSVGNTHQSTPKTLVTSHPLSRKIPSSLPPLYMKNASLLPLEPSSTHGTFSKRKLAKIVSGYILLYFAVTS